MQQAAEPAQDSEIEARKRLIIDDYALRRLLNADFQERNQWGERAVALGFPKEELKLAPTALSICPWVKLVAQEMFLAGLFRIDFAKELAKEPTPKKKTAEIIQLPLWAEVLRGVPNDILRSALFSATQGRKREYIKEQTVAASDNIKIKFTGEQLDQSDLDVWDQIIHLVRSQPHGQICVFKAGAFLKSIGRSAGKSEYVWLHSTLTRLKACAVEFSNIKIGKRSCRGLIADFEVDDNTKVYKVTIDERVGKLYLSGWSGIHFEQRQALRGKSIALWLHGYFSSHAEPYPIKVETLRFLCGSKDKTIRSFRQKLREALDNLKACGALVDWQIDPDSDLVTVDRGAAITDSQRRHLAKNPPKRTRNPKNKPET